MLRDNATLGTGTYGNVTSATWERGNGEVVRVAVKRFYENIETKSFLREIEVSYIISNPGHPAVLPIFAFDIVRPAIVSELAHTDLERVLYHPSTVDNLEWNATKASIALLGIADGMRHIHSFNVMHRDLKPANITLDQNFWPKIADFGLIRVESLNSTEDRGTPLYMASEQMTNIASLKSDVYAFGLIAFELAARTRPYAEFTNQFKLTTFVTNGGRHEIAPGTMSEALSKLVTDCWAQEEEERPTFEEVVRRILRDKIVINQCSPDCEEYQRYCRLLTLDAESQVDEDQEWLCEEVQ
jgi:serine/threonine protein kinase